LPDRPLYRIPEALALGDYTISRWLVEAVIMMRTSPRHLRLAVSLRFEIADCSVKSTVQILRFFSAVIFAYHAQEPRYYYTLGTMTLIAGILEAILGFWKEIAARVHQPGQPKYYDSPHAAHRGWYS
jgi:hypothetical protein